MIPKLVVSKDVQVFDDTTMDDKVILCDKIDELLSMNEKMKQELEELKSRVKKLD